MSLTRHFQSLYNAHEALHDLAPACLSSLVPYAPTSSTLALAPQHTGTHTHPAPAILTFILFLGCSKFIPSAGTLIFLLLGPGALVHLIVA